MCALLVAARRRQLPRPTPRPLPLPAPLPAPLLSTPLLPTLQKHALAADVVDLTGTLDAHALIYLNRNLTWVDRLTPFRVLLLVLPKQPRDYASRHLYATQLLRHWYAGTRMLERAALIVMSLDGAVEIAVGHQCKLVLSDAVARHFAIKATECATTRGRTAGTWRTRRCRCRCRAAVAAAPLPRLRRSRLRSAVALARRARAGSSRATSPKCHPSSVA